MNKGVMKLLIALAMVALFTLLHYLAGELIAAVSVAAVVQVGLALYALNVVMTVIVRMVTRAAQK